jgi:hypothetical protein
VALEAARKNVEGNGLQGRVTLKRVPRGDYSESLFTVVVPCI